MTGVAKARVPTGGRLTTPNWGLVAPFRSSSSSRTPASHPSPQSLLSTGSGADPCIPSGGFKTMAVRSFHGSCA